MERLIQLIQTAHAEAGAVAWWAAGVLLVAGIVLGMVTLFWIFSGGIGVRNTQELLAHQRQVDRWLRDHRL